MRNLLGIFLLIGLAWVGCAEEITPEEQAALDQTEIETYISEEGLVGNFTEDGIFYAITSGADTSQGFPSLADSVLLYYEGAFLNGEVFAIADSANAQPLLLSTYIDGLELGLQLFNKGASGVLIVPSGLAYGTSGNGIIPPNTVLRYDLTLVDFY